MVPDIASAYKGRMKVADLDSAKEIEIFERTKADVEEAGIVFKNDMDVIRVTMNRADTGRYHAGSGAPDLGSGEGLRHGAV